MTKFASQCLGCLVLFASLGGCVTTETTPYGQHGKHQQPGSQDGRFDQVRQRPSAMHRSENLDANRASPCSPQCEVNVVNAHPHEALQQHADRLGISVDVKGTLLDPVSINAEQPTVDQLVRELASHGGYLVGRQGERYTFYGKDLEEITIAFPLSHIQASDAASQLSRFEEVDVFVLQNANALVVRGSSEQVRGAASFLDIIDYERPNVYLELMVVEYFHGDDFAWSFDIVNAQRSEISDLTVAPGAGLLSGQYDVIADLDESFRFNLTTLIEDSYARVVTNPHIAVRSGQPGQINFAEELNIVLTNATENFGVTRNLQKLEAGISLNVTPQVLSSGFVDLKVDGEVSVFVPAPEGQFAVDRQKVQTEVLVEDSDTLVIGGLVTKQVSSTESGVPGLRRVPLLGKLFSSESTSERYVETVVYITPHINKPGAFMPGRISNDVEKQFQP
jgi:type II secretory pathway component GspD/PulD (secretin)